LAAWVEREELSDLETIQKDELAPAKLGATGETVKI